MRTVTYLGANDEQVRWGGGSDPREYLVVGRSYELDRVDVHSMHTRFYLSGLPKVWFNSACFSEPKMKAENSEAFNAATLAQVAAVRPDLLPQMHGILATPQDLDVSTYTPGVWFDATTVDLMEAFYLSRLPAIKEAAKEHGYAIGVHGSLRRDLDLIAVPWRDSASSPDVLAEAIQRAACGFGMASRQWEKKPAGRIATSLPICWTHRKGVTGDGHIDLSVFPPTP